ncbi:hypothetical protein OGZ01_09360 [Vibrio harveyi]|nr:hypothetical protein [Vibrio harveyi]
MGDLGTLEYNTGSGWVAVPNDGLVTVPAGSTQFDVRIDTLNDAVFEQDEDFSVSVVGVGPVLGSDVGNATIIDNDAPPAISDVIDAVVSEEGLTDGIPMIPRVLLPILQMQPASQGHLQLETRIQRMFQSFFLVQIHSHQVESLCLGHGTAILKH